MPRRRLLVALALVVLVGGGFAAARAVRDTHEGRSMSVTVDVSGSGDPITAIRFDFLPEGTLPESYVASNPDPGERALKSIAGKLPVALPKPDATPTSSCTGLAVRFQLRSGRELYYLPCRRPDVVASFLRAVGAGGFG